MPHSRTPLGVVIFDYDDTLVDTSTPWIRAWEAEYIALGLEPSPNFWAFVELTNSDPGLVLRHMFGDRITNARRNDICASVMDEIRCAGVMPGGLELLDNLRSVGVASALVTNGSLSWLRSTMPSGLRGWFTTIHPSAGKPNDEAFHRTLGWNGVGPEAAVGIDNAPWGIGGLQMAGITPLFVPNATYQKLELPGVARRDSLVGLNAEILSMMRPIARAQEGPNASRGLVFA